MTTNRRNIVTGMLAATTLPAAALAAPGEVDPIFKLIETAKDAESKKERHNVVRDDFEESLPEEVTRCQRVLVGMNGDEPIYAQNSQQIDMFFVHNVSLSLAAINCDRQIEILRKKDGFAHYNGSTNAAIEQFYAELPIAKAEAHAELDRDIARMETVQESSGLRAMRDESNQLFQEWCDAHLDVMDCHPTTAAGASAKLEYMLEKIRDGSLGDDECVEESLDHFAKSLAKLAA
jgi:hypothetical protein